MDLAPFVKKLVLPEGFAAPRTLTFEDIVATALARSDLDDDVRGINSSLELIARTRGGGWPTGPVDDEFNYVDLVWHEQEFREQTSFAYVVREADGGGYLGCAYLYPVGRRTPLSDELLACDVDVSWWVTEPAYERGCYETLHRALGRWVVEDFPFRVPHYSNVEIP